MSNNVGDIKTFVLAGAPTDGGGYAYCWQWWDNTVDVTATPVKAKQINQGGSLAFAVIQSDALGRSNVYNSIIVVNQPPIVVGSPSISKNDGLFPFNGTMTSVAYDPEHPGGTELTFQWFNGASSLGAGVTTVLSTGTYQNSLAAIALSQNTTYSQVITDSQNGATRLEFSMRGILPTGLQGSGSAGSDSLAAASNNTSSAFIGPTQQARFTVYAQDSAAGQLQFVWTLKQIEGWSADYTTTDTPAQLANGSYRSQISRATANETPGLRRAYCKVTNLTTGQFTTIISTVSLIGSLAPTILNISTSAPLVDSVYTSKQSTALFFTGTAIDANNAIPTYRWDFTQTGASYYGRTVMIIPGESPVFDQSVLAASGPKALLGNLVVTDRYGKSDSKPIESFAKVFISAA